MFAPAWLLDCTGAGQLSAWAAKLTPHLLGRTLYAFFNNDYRANAPRNAAVFRELLRGL